MPTIVLRHENKSVLPFVTDIPVGVDPKEVEAAYPGWTLDKKVSVADARAEHDKGVTKARAKFAEDNDGATPESVASAALLSK